MRIWVKNDRGDWVEKKPMQRRREGGRRHVSRRGLFAGWRRPTIGPNGMILF